MQCSCELIRYGSRGITVSQSFEDLSQRLDVRIRPDLSFRDQTQLNHPKNTCFLESTSISFSFAVVSRIQSSEPCPDSLERQLVPASVCTQRGMFLEAMMPIIHPSTWLHTRNFARCQDLTRSSHMEVLLVQHDMLQCELPRMPTS